jgi:hypothetical protein
MSKLDEMPSFSESLLNNLMMEVPEVTDSPIKNGVRARPKILRRN